MEIKRDILLKEFMKQQNHHYFKRLTELAEFTELRPLVEVLRVISYSLSSLLVP